MPEFVLSNLELESEIQLSFAATLSNEAPKNAHVGKSWFLPALKVFLVHNVHFYSKLISP